MLCNFTFSWDAAAFVVAACALGLTILSHKSTERHNRLSVRPNLASSTHMNHVVYESASNIEVEMTLANVGLGPAVIKRMEVLLDEVAIPVETPDDVRAQLQVALPGVQVGATVAFRKLNYEHAMAAGEVVDIVRFQLVDPPRDFRKQVERFAVVVRYESMYGDPSVYDSRKHRAIT